MWVLQGRRLQLPLVKLLAETAMSSVIVIAVIIIALASLVSYAFISQTLTHKREHQERVINALTSKTRNFKFMLSGFPQGFLPPELTLLIQKSLLEIYSQLSELEPANVGHRGEIQALSLQMSETRRQATRRSNIHLENHQQISEVKACLEELHKYIFQLEEKNLIQRESADAHRASIRELVISITVDSYTIAGKQAFERDKPRLALHSFNLALNLMQRERKLGNFDQRIIELQHQCAELSTKIAEQTEGGNTALPSLDADTQSKLESEWDSFEHSSPDWKKKQLYD